MAYGGYGDVGASQFGGGGFMPSPAPGHGNDHGGGGPQKGRNQHNSLRAFTIRHLLKETSNADDERYMADGHEISTVTIVGHVVSYNEGPTRVLLVVNDGTGSIEVCSWVDDVDTQAQKRLDWQIGRYVRVYGNLKTFERKRSITAFAVKPITDHNEVTYHMLQSVMQHLHLTKGPPPTGQSAGGAMPSMGGKTPGGTSYGGAPAGGYGGMPHSNYGTAPTAPSAPGGSDIATDVKHVYNLPHALSAPNGLSADQALNELRNMGRNYTMQQLMQTCDLLAAEGLLYNTVNDTTYKSTGA